MIDVDNVGDHRRFTLNPGGRKQRQGTGGFEQSTNRYQRRLTRVYDTWSAKTRRILAQAAARGAPVQEQIQIFDSALPGLKTELATVIENGIRSAARVASEGHFKDTAVQDLMSQYIREDIAKLDDMIPAIRERLLPGITGGKALSKKDLGKDFLRARSAPPLMAGGFWVMIFATKQTLGKQREHDRIAQGLEIEPVRWNLDPRASHCKASPGHYGCPDLAGVYQGGWSTLKTVPAGLVTCRGNCKCNLEVKRDGQWRRGVYED